MKPISSRRRPQRKAESNNGSGLESILKETPKLILARRISKALSQVSKGSPLTVAQAKDVLVFIMTYLETHPDADLPRRSSRSGRRIVLRLSKFEPFYCRFSSFWNIRDLSNIAGFLSRSLLGLREGPGPCGTSSVWAVCYV